MSRWRTPEAALALILIFSVIVRIFFFFQLAATDLVTVPMLDSQDYHDWAVQLVSGNPGWGETYWMGPLYPHLLALVYMVFGVGGMAISVLQLLLSVVNIALVFFLTRDFLADRTATWAAPLAAGIFALYGAPVFYAGLILMATLVTTLYLLIARQALVAWRQNTTTSWLVLGLLTGLAGLARGNILLLLATLPLLIFKSNIEINLRLKKTTAFILAGLIMLVPVTVRNLVVADDFVILTSNGGINLLIGQQTAHKGIFGPIVKGSQSQYDASMKIPLEQEFGRYLKGSEISRILTRRAMEEFRDNIGAMPLHYLRKMYRFWNGYELPQIFSYDYWHHAMPALRVLFIPFTLLAALGLLGVRFLPGGQRLIMGLMLGTYFLSLVPFFPTSRYRIPLAPLLAIGAGVFLVYVWQMKWPRQRRWLLAAVVLICALLPRWASLAPQEVTWLVHLHEASRASKRNDLKTTLAKGELAEEVRPGLADTPYHLALYLEDMEAWPQAMAALQLAANRSTKDPLIPYRVGVFQDKQGQLAEALDSFRRAANLDPQWSMPWLQAGSTLRKAGQMDDAISALEKAYEMSPGNHQIRSNLASAYAATGQFDAALPLLEKLVVDYPFYVNGWFNLAMIELQLGNPGRAQTILRNASSLRNLTAGQIQRIDELLLVAKQQETRSR